MSSGVQNGANGSEEDVSSRNDFSIKFSNSSANDDLCFTKTALDKNLKGKHDTKQNSNGISAHTKIKRNTKEAAISVNGETTSKYGSTESNVGEHQSSKLRFTPTSTVRYDEVFIERLSEDTRGNQMSSDTEVTALLLPEDQEESTNLVEKQSSVDSTVTEQSSSPSFSFRALGNKHKLILISICLCNFLAYLCLSLIAPFFPEEAAKKNVSDSVSGWIFGVYAFTQFLLSPVFGRLIPYTGVRFMYNGGLFLAAGCTVLFGCLTYMDTTNENITFIVYCFLLRIMLALGCLGLQTATFTITAKEFPDSVATVFGITEVFVGIGFMSGPPIGGFMYASGGFVTPFAVVGALMFIGVPFNVWLIPTDSVIEKSSESTTSVLVLLKSSKTIINCLAIVIAALIFSILDPTLEPYLNDTFKLDSEIIGLLFLLMAASYAVSAPVVGIIADKVNDNRSILIPGFIISAVGMALLGPSDFLGIDTELWLVIICLTVLGVATSLTLIPTFDLFIDIATEMGMDDDLEMYGMVAGLWGSMYAFGDFLGPSVAGFLYDQFGFAFCCSVTAAALLFMVPVLTIAFLYDTRCCRQNAWKTDQSHQANKTTDERTPLLTNSMANYDNEIMVTYPPTPKT